MRERTYEITDYCPHDCPFCSSDTTDNPKDAIFMSVADIAGDLANASGSTGNFDGVPFDRIIISGGEPLAHPQFYQILKLCEEYSKDVVVYSNAIRHIVYNASVIDGVYVEANLTVLPNVGKLHILKRVEQGREAKRPEVKLSSNWDGDCSKECEHVVVRPDGSLGRPCLKKARVSAPSSEDP